MKSNYAYVIPALLVLALAQPGSLSAEDQDGEWFPAIQVDKQPLLDVPYVPTPPEVVNRMLNMAEVGKTDILYDLGCGDGRIVVAAAKDRNVRRAVGVDIDPQRIQEGRANARKAGVDGRVTFLQTDLFEVDLRDATVVSLYLLPSINLKLRPKLLRELQPGTRIVSHDFDMGEWQPDRSVSLNGHTVYFWVVPSNVNGTWKWSSAEAGVSHRYELRLRQQFQTVESAELILDDVPKAVTDVRVAGDMLQFVVTMKGDGKTKAVHYSATVSGDSLKGTATAEQSGKEKKWQADRAPASAMPVDALSGQKVQL